MTKGLVRYIVTAGATLGALVAAVNAQSTPTDGVPVSVVLSVKAHHDVDLSKMTSENLVVMQGRDRDKVTEVVPLQGDRAGLELYIMMDDSRALSFGTQLEDIRQFILDQPPTTKIGVVYMAIGGPKIVQELTADHAAAAKAVETPLGRLANGESPYSALTDLMAKWPASSNRREVVMISDGEDATYSDFPGQRSNTHVDTAVQGAERNGIVVFTIATSHQNIESREFGSSGKYYLSELAEGTGGQFYYYDSSAPVSFRPYFHDLTQRLQGQFLVTFLAKPAKKSGMQAIKVRTELRHVELVSPDKIYLPATTVAALQP